MSGGSARGLGVYAATFIRERRVVLDAALFNRPALLRFILIHELFHFAWVRLGNRAKAEFAALLLKEHKKRAKGELGESSTVKKDQLGRGDADSNSRLWRDYICESFCDTAAWILCGKRETPCAKLAQRWKNRRTAWFGSCFAGGVKC